MTFREALRDMARGAIAGLVIGLVWCVVFFAGAFLAISATVDKYPQCFEVTQ